MPSDTLFAIASLRACACATCSTAFKHSVFCLSNSLFVIAPLSSSVLVRTHSSSASCFDTRAEASAAWASRADSAADRTSSWTTDWPSLTCWPRSIITLMTLPCVSAVTSDRWSAATVPVSTRTSGVGASAAATAWTLSGTVGGLTTAELSPPDCLHAAKITMISVDEAKARMALPTLHGACQRVQRRDGGLARSRCMGTRHCRSATRRSIRSCEPTCPDNPHRCSDRTDLRRDREYEHEYD